MHHRTPQHQQLHGRRSVALSHRRGSRPVPGLGGRRFASPHGATAGAWSNHNPVARMALGGLVLYVLSTIVYQPIDSKETAAKMRMTQQRGGPSSQHIVPAHHKPGDKHSPLMLLREREQARREQQEKQKQQLRQEQMDDPAKDRRKHAEGRVEKETEEGNQDADVQRTPPEETDEGQGEGDDNYNAEEADGQNDENGEEDQGNDVVEDGGGEGEGGTEADEAAESREVVVEGSTGAGSEAGAAQLIQAAGADLKKRKSLLQEVLDQRQKEQVGQVDEQPAPQLIVEQHTLLEQLTNDLSDADRDRILLEIQQGQARIASYMHQHVKDPEEQQRWTKAYLKVQHRLHPHLVQQQQHKEREGQNGQNQPKSSDNDPKDAARGGQLGVEEGQKVFSVSNATASNAHGNATMPKEKKVPPKKKERRLPKMDHSADSAGPIEGDPLRAPTWPFEYKKIDMTPSVEYLGTLIDGGRHYFRIEWLKRIVDRLADMNYNLIHLRLTDDQTFNLLLKSRPELAYPQAVDNPERKVWTVDEMKDLTAYAKAKGVSIMPEINVPGHAGAWYGIPDMVVHCPRFICERGYGLPLNVTHHELKPILTDIIKEVVSIFDDPPFLHLGGDEVNMADNCFHEVGRERFDYPEFERVLKDIIKDSGYPEERIVRWEMTGQAGLDRAGAIEHFWESHPGDRHNARGRFFVSTWMYLDTNNQQNAFDVYEKANINFHRGGELPSAIIVGTFELSEQFWYDRNVLGRLLSVAIGANNPKFPNDRNEKAKAVTELWKTHCETLGLGEIICETEGRPVVETWHYHEKWRRGWDVWKKDICDRLTEKIDYKGFSRDWRARHRGVESANEYFWAHFPLEASSIELEAMNDTAVPDDLKAVLKHTVPHTGVIIDAVSNMPKLMRLHSIIRTYVASMGFNLVQLRLVGKAGFSFMPSSLPNLGQSVLSDTENPLYAPEELSSLVESAAAVGVAIMPEITVSTDAAGWIQAGFTIDCPLRFCKGKSLPNNVNSQELLPVLYSVIGELRTIFTSSKLFHLGTDERSAAAACWEEAGEAPDYDKFESRMEALLALVNLAPEETLRWENGEGFRYPGRAGGVTQFPAGQLDDIRPDDPFFLTIDLFDGNAYNIFKNAKKAVALEPLGVLADLPKLSESKFDNWEIPKRLLAFSMGISELANAWSFNEEATFESEFEQLCRALNLADDCSPPDDQDIDVDLVPESPEFIQKQCETFVTEFENILIAKKPVLPWFENGVARIEVQIS